MRLNFKTAATIVLAAFTGLAAHAQQPPIKVGLMLPATGTYAALGTAIENGFKLYVQEHGGKLGGREIEYFKVDDESDPSKATDNVNKLIKRDNVDVLVGTVHSGVALGMAKAAKDNNTLLIVPNAGADAITGPMCAPNIVRSSFSNWPTVASRSWLARAMRSRTSTWCAMSRKVVGSSNSMTGASRTSAMARNTRWRCPPESCSAGRCRNSAVPVLVSARETAASSSRLHCRNQRWCG